MVWLLMIETQIYKNKTKIKEEILVLDYIFKSPESKAVK